MPHGHARVWRRTLQGSQEQPSSTPTPPTEPFAGRNPRTTRIIVAVVAIIVIIAGIVTYIYVTQHNQCVLVSKNPLIFDQAEPSDTLDPQVTFSTPGWAQVQQVYQTLVMYNQSSYTSFVGVLAKSWTESSDHMNVTFSLRTGIHFSNGDPFNAYVMWYSLYRTLVLNLDPAFILTQNFGFPHTNDSSDTGAINASVANVTQALNTFDFSNPTSAEIAVMTDPDQSFQVIDNETIQLNLGRGYLGEAPYTYLFSTLASPVASAVDPIVIAQNGGVADHTNDWMSAHMLGTGPYTQTSYDSTTGSYTLTPDPNYWGTTAAASEPWNNALQAAKSTIQIDIQGDPVKTSSDLKTGHVAGASFDYLGPSTISALQSSPCVSVQALDPVYGSTAGAWWIYMNQNVEPFNNLSVRAAVVHAINYTRMIQQAFGGHAIRWVGPVPPGYPYYNPSNLAPYAYNLTLAKKFMSESPWPSGYPTTLNYMYLNTADWEAVATFLQNDLAQIGIRLNLVPITLTNLYSEQVRDQNGLCTSETTANGGPFYIGQEFYTSDYISPDDWTQNNALSYGSANDCMAQYVNDTMDNLVLTAAATSDSTQLTQMYTQMTQMMYDNYTVAWLVSPTSFAVSSPFLKGVVSNPMGSGLPYVMTYNTEYAS